MNSPIREINKKFVDGEGLTDSELTCLLDYYDDFTDLSQYLDISLSLFDKELNIRLKDLKDLQRNRQSDGIEYQKKAALFDKELNIRLKDLKDSQRNRQ